MCQWLTTFHFLKLRTAVFGPASKEMYVRSISEKPLFPEVEYISKMDHPKVKLS